MKKSLLVISVILLIAGLFISCNSEAAESSSDLAYVKFADDSKGLDSSITGWSTSLPGVNDLKWYYKASKASGAQVGATSSWTPVKDGNGLTGSEIGPFSVGNWKFEVIGCEPGNTPTSATAISGDAWSTQTFVKYAGVSGTGDSNTTAANVALQRGVTNTIPVVVSRYNIPSAPNKIYITYPSVTYDAGEASGTLYYKVYINDDEITSLRGNAPVTSNAIEITRTEVYEYAFSGTDFGSGVTVKFEVYDDSVYTADFKLAEDSVSFPAIKGSTVRINGTLGSLSTVYASFGSLKDLTESSAVATYEAYLYHGGSYIPKATLDAAINDAADGDTVGLLKDISSPQINIVDKSITLNGNGHTLTSSASNNTNHTGNTLSGYSCFAIALYTTDSKAQELIDGDSNPIQLTVENLKIVSTSARYGLYFDGYVVGTVDSCDINIPGSSVCSGAYINSEHKVYPSTVTVKGSEIGFSSGESVDDWMGTTLSVSGGGILIVDGGTYEGIKSLSTFTSGGKITVNSGTFTGEIKNYAITSNYSNLKYAENDSSVNSVIEINGGVFTSCTFDCDSGTVTTITGGTFDANPFAYVNHSTHKVYSNTATNPTYIVVANGASHTGYNTEVTQ